MVYQQRLNLTTSGHRDMHDLTDGVNRIVAESGVQAGIAHVFAEGSTAAVGTIEFEPGLRKDPPAITATSKPGTTAMVIRTCKRRCSARRCRCRSAAASRTSALGSKSSTWSATSGRANALSS